MSNTIITKSIFLKASRQTVWAFLTDGEKLGEWFYRCEGGDLQAGQDYVLMGKDDDGTPAKRCWGKVLEMDPPSKLVMTFSVAPLNGVMTNVTYMLEEVGAGTKLSLEHSGLEAAGDVFGLVMALDSGWDKHFASMREAVNKPA